MQTNDNEVTMLIKDFDKERIKLDQTKIRIYPNGIGEKYTWDNTNVTKLKDLPDKMPRTDQLLNFDKTYACQSSHLR